MSSLFKNPLQWMAAANFNSVLIVHVILGLLSTVSPFFLIGWFYFLLINYIGASPTVKKRVTPYLLLYIFPIELLGRMSHAYPFIPTEMGKYLSILVLLYAVSSLGGPIKKTYWPPWAMLLLSIPSLMIVPFTFYAWRYEVVYNYLGLFSLCLYVVYFARQIFYLDDIKGMLRVVLAGIVAVLAYSVIKSPAIEPSAFELSSSTTFTGGFGANQVSSVLGVGIGIAIFVWLFQIEVTSFAILMSILGLSLMWSLLSFSRGGVVTAGLAIFMALMVSDVGRQKLFQKGRFFFISISAVVVFFVVNDLTGGQLILRYQGETAGTIAGHKEKNLDYITSNRSLIVVNDFEMWRDNFILGVGAGQSKNTRPEYGLEPMAPHVELTRLVAEHGLLGFFIAIILLGIGVIRVSNEKNARARSFAAFLLTIAILSTMHSAMRTVVSPLTFGFAFARFGFFNREPKKKPKPKANPDTEISNSMNSLPVA